MRRSLPPLPLRKKGVSKASDAELDSGASVCEKCAVWGAVLVLVGLLLEVWIAVKHPPFDSLL
jgi:hypothetical protein